MAYDDAVRRLKPNKAHAYVNFVEPLSTDEANLNNSYPSQQKQFVTGGQQPRIFPEPDMMMMGRSGEVTMSGTTPVNHWPQLLGRMAFLPTRTPETSMMMHQHPMVGNQLLFDHGTEGCQQAMPAINGQQLLYGPPPNLQQLPRLGNSMALSQTLGEASEQCWGQQVDTYGVGMEQQIPSINSQWPTWRGVSHVNGSMVGRSFNEDMMRTHVIPNQLPHPASQRPIMWEGAMGLVKMPGIDAMNCREPIRTQVQALVQGSSLETMMNMSQQSSGSNWSSQFSANPNLTDEGASSINFGSRGFMPCGWS